MVRFVAFLKLLKLRVFIIASTVLQLFLAVWTSQRANISSQPLRRIIWLVAYMAAEFSANLTLGGIFQENVSSSPATCANVANNKFLTALWAPFILLHLGRHSKMTVFSLVDYEYWLKHVFRFLYYEFPALCICILAFEDRRVRYPLSIMFIIGTLKFGERILALKQGSIGLLRDTMVKEEFEGVPREKPRAHKKGVPEMPHPNIDVARRQPYHDDIQLHNLCEAFNYFEQSKGIYADADPLHYTRGGYNRFQCFDEMNAPQVLSQLQKELSFAYDLFYTKTFTSHTFGGWAIRVLSLASIFSATLLFSHTDKSGFHHIDVTVTYILLIVTLTNEVFGFFEAILSDYTMVQVIAHKDVQWRPVESIIKYLRDSKEKVKELIFPGKQNRVGQFGMVNYGIEESKTSPWVKSLVDLIGQKELWTNYYHIHYDSLDDHSELIFTRIKEALKGQLPQHYEGGAIPAIFPTLVSEHVLNRLEGTLSENADSRNFEECIIIWHIATYICFTQRAPNLEQEEEEERPSELVCANFLSDYVLYLLGMNSSMVSLLATDNLRSYRTICSVLIKKFEGYVETENEHACDRLMAIQDTNGPEKLLVQGCKVAEELTTAINGGHVNWDTLLCLWVDVLCFAAMKCQGECHAEHLGSGGQFLTYIWLFIKHLIGDWCASTPLNIVIEN